MSTTLHAVHDIFTFVCDCSLNRQSRVWRWQNPDRYRLRLLRRLAREAALVDPLTGQPTILIEDWLHLPPSEQLAILANAWAEQAETPSRKRCLEQVLALDCGTRLTPVEFTGRQSARNQRLLWLPLVWLGYLDVDEEQSDSPILSVAPISEQLVDSPAWTFADLTVLVDPPYNWADLWALEHIALLQEVGPPRRYLLTGGQASAQQTPDFRPAAAVDLLEKASGEALPPMVLDVFKPYADILIQQGAVLTFSDPEQLTALRRSLAWQKRLGHVLSAVHVWVPAANVVPIMHALQRQGLSVQIEPFPPTAVSARPTWQDNDYLRLLVAARVLGSLAEELGLTAPLDGWTLARLTTHLPADRQRRLERLVNEQVREIRQRLPELEAAAHDQPPEQILAVIGQAIEEGRTLQLFYQPPAPRPLITRPVIPLRLETWGVHTYLRATCLHRRAARSFRVDRITAVEAADEHAAGLPAAG